MNRIFGTSKPQAPKQSINDVILATDARSDNVSIKIKKLEVELNELKNQMAKMRDGPGKNALKQKAIRLLKQKKLYEGQKDQLMQQSFNMEQVNMTTDNLKNTFITLDAMQTANNEMKKQYKKVNLEKIDQLQDEMEDLMERANEVQESLSRSYAVDDIDEADLEAELDALGNDFAFEEDNEVPSYLQEDLNLPNAANNELELPGTLPKQTEQPIKMT
ncbi:hypothetical protein HK099_008376 [Clydaea vesicula]|uniref:Charged multivesicular body protein 5 n=1 Tax=Clydaea vesicula TaxID=447962 RepID=A0AAD5U4Y7_9FUNG|nr:hypothetical protein HK099_008376 [Clydaea vesicula]KAJ3397324.1 hypothetical protein HDU92_008867 [Lobulomyces angularis]